MAERFHFESQPLIPSWSSTPVPNLSLSAAGLLALADLTTVSHRTVITGGSSWLDALVLAPGLHYQQAVDALDSNLAAVLQQQPEDRSETRFSVNNAAMAQYLRRIWQQGSNSVRELTLNVDLKKPEPIIKRILGKKNNPDWLSHVFYLSSPVLTLTSGTLMVLLADWWGLSFIVAMMTSRILNIWSIKQRSRPTKPLQPDTTPDHHGQYAIDLGNGSRILLRGFRSDIQAVTTQTWLRKQSVSESYLEAAAKLLVYLVAAFSGNQTQAGSMVLMALLLTSAGFLALSNAHAKGLHMNGRIARLEDAAAAVAQVGANAQNNQHKSGKTVVVDLPKHPPVDMMA